MLLSACLIVKNEAENLGRCLASLKGAVDEVVVLDTGSTDGTVDLATEMGAMVSHFTWCDDFAAARNESLRLAKGDWLFWIDADEALVQSQPDALRALCRQCPPKTTGFLVGQHNLIDEGGRVGTITWQWRLWRRRTGCRFKGRVHEQLTPPEGVHVHLQQQELAHVLHWGYLPKGDHLDRKSERNQRLIALSIEEAPDDLHQHYNMGRQYYADGQTELSLQHLEQAIDMWEGQGSHDGLFVPILFYMAVTSAVESGQPERALAIEARTPDRYLTSDLLYFAGRAHAQLGHESAAIERWTRSYSDPGLRFMMQTQPALSTWRPRLALAQLHASAGRNAEALPIAREARQLAPEEPEVLFTTALLAHRAGHGEESIEVARTLLAGDRDEGWKAQARRLLFDIGDAAGNPDLLLESLAGGDVAGVNPADGALVAATAHALKHDQQAQYDTLDEACRSFPADARIRLALAKLLDDEGHADQAVVVLAGGLDQPGQPAELYQRLGLLLAKQGRLDDAARALEMATRLSSQTPTD